MFALSQREAVEPRNCERYVTLAKSSLTAAEEEGTLSEACRRWLEEDTVASRVLPSGASLEETTLDAVLYSRCGAASLSLSASIRLSRYLSRSLYSLSLALSLSRWVSRFRSR